MASRATAFLESLTDFGIKLGLDKTKLFLSKLGNPHEKYPSVLIAGTNGKGSVAKTLSEILRASGRKVGLYTSPHLLDVRERIVVDGRMVPREAFTEGVERLRCLLDGMPVHLFPTYFEAMTIIAYDYCARAGVDILVSEVGMGGRFDATNVLPSCLEVITPVSFDHMQFLGSTLSQIAQEKAGIIKPKTPVICARQKPEVLAVIRRKARERRARLLVMGKDFTARRTALRGLAQEICFSSAGYRIAHVVTRLLGRHQVENAALAIQSARMLARNGFVVTDDHIRQGVSSTVWPARLQVLSTQPLVLVDGAHNPGGVKVLMEALKEIDAAGRFSFLVGILRDKDWKKMLCRILPSAASVIFARPDTERALDPEDLAAYARKVAPGTPVRVIPKAGDALREALSGRCPVVVCGSLYLAADVLKAWKKIGARL